MPDLKAFIAARIAEDEQRQRGRTDEDWHEFRCDINRKHPGTKVPYPCDCIAPACVLAECEAKRRIVTLWEYAPPAWDDSPLWDVLIALAGPYSDHPDFDPSWRLGNGEPE